MTVLYPRLNRLALPRLAASPGPLLATAGLLAILAASIVLAFDAAAAPSFLVPGGRRVFPGWVAGPFAAFGERTTWAGFGVLLLIMLGGWLVVMVWARTMPRAMLIAGIVAAHVVFLLAPPLLSADVFGYVGLARLGTVHHLNPYLVGTLAAHHDPILPFLRWHNAQSPYGPLFTGLSYVLVPLGVAGQVWAFKVLAFAASLGGVALVWRLAERRGVQPHTAAALVGLNPALLAFEVGGGHNDAIVVLVTLAAIALVLSERSLAGGASVAAAVAMKASAGIVAPFAVLGSRRPGATLMGAAIALLSAAVLAVALFGSAADAMFTTLQTAGRGVAVHSVPNAIARALGAGSISGTGRLAAQALVAVVCLFALWRVWRGADWIAGAGWATLAFLCGTTWLLPWYVTWLTPLAALSRDRRLQISTVIFVAYVVATRVSFLLA